MDMTIRMWDRTNLAPRRKFTGPTKGVHSLIYSPRLRTIVCASTETVLTVFTPFMEKSLFKMTGHSVPLSGVVMLPDAQRIMSYDQAGCLKVWDLSSSECTQTFQLD